MATLKGTTISETYPLLLKIASSGVDGTLRNIEDGDGTASALQISSSAVNVNGALTASSSFTLDNASGSGVIRSQSSADNTVDLTASSGGDAFIEASDTSEIKIGHASSTKLTIDTHSNGGDATFASNLTVDKSISAGNPNTAPIVTFKNSQGSGHYTAIKFEGADSSGANTGFLGYLSHNTSATRKFVFSHDGTTRDLAINGDSSVTFAGDLTISNSIPLILMNDTSGNKNNQIIFQAGGSNIFRIGTDITTNNGTQLLQVTDGDGNNSRIEVNSSGFVGIQSNDTSGDLNLAGSFGAPLHILQKPSSQAYGLVVQGNSNANGARLGIAEADSNLSTRANTLEFGFDSSTDFIYSRTGKDMIIGVNSDERLRITNEGRVIQKNTSLANSCFDIVNGSSSGYGLYIKAGNSGNYALSVNDYNANNLMVVNGNGNVGIGITSPSKTITVAQGSPVRIPGNWEVVDVLSATSDTASLQSDNCFNDNIYSQFKIVIPYINAASGGDMLLFTFMYNSGGGLTEHTGDYYTSSNISRHNNTSHLSTIESNVTRATIFQGMHSDTGVGVSGEIMVYDAFIADLREYTQFTANTQRYGDGATANDRGSNYRPMLDVNLVGYNTTQSAYVSHRAMVRCNTGRHASYWKGFKLQTSSGNLDAGSQVIVMGRAV